MKIFHGRSVALLHMAADKGIGLSMDSKLRSLMSSPQLFHDFSGVDRYRRWFLFSEQHFLYSVRCRRGRDHFDRFHIHSNGH